MELKSVQGWRATLARFGIAVFLIVMQACAVSAPEQPPQPVSVAATDDDTARFLAGLPVPQGSPFYATEQSPEWNKYSSAMQTEWSETDKNQFALVDAFQQRELARLHSHNFVFYPFSGPDVLYMMRFFPGSRVYVMCGLEPLGALPTPETFTTYQDYKFKYLEGVTRGIFRRSFFVTKDMKDTLQGGVANGAVPVICLLLARSGMSIDQLRFGRLDDTGRFVEVDRNSAEATGIELSFHGELRTIETLYYFRSDLGAPFATNLAVQRFLDRLGTPDTFIKSASFLMHSDDFSAIRGYILAKSNLVLQDDSGIPYRYFKQAGWKVELFGQYSEPDKSFKNMRQQDLASDFSDPAKVKPLGFPIGYGSHRRPSSMMLAIRPAKN